jgi:hypothetical protein
LPCAAQAGVVAFPSAAASDGYFEGLGDKLVEQIVDAQLVRVPPPIFIAWFDLAPRNWSANG